MEVEHILGPLHRLPLPLSKAIFKTTISHLHADLAAQQHNAREARELAQHGANYEAPEDQPPLCQGWADIQRQIQYSQVREVQKLINKTKQGNLPDADA